MGEIIQDPARIIETEEQVKEVISEIQAQAEMTQEEVNLANAKRLKETYAQMEKIWSSMTRKQRRQMIRPQFKYSNRIKKRLK